MCVVRVFVCLLLLLTIAICRPEFMQRLRLEFKHPPLSPDALTPFGREHKEVDHNANSTSATQVLLEQCIPGLAAALLRFSVEELQRVSLGQLFHQHGVNMVSFFFCLLIF